MVDDKIKELIYHIAKESSIESFFLTPQPSYSISTESVLDKIRELYGLSKEEVNSIIDEKEEL